MIGLKGRVSSSSHVVICTPLMTIPLRVCWCPIDDSPRLCIVHKSLIVSTRVFWLPPVRLRVLNEVGWFLDTVFSSVISTRFSLALQPPDGDEANECCHLVDDDSSNCDVAVLIDVVEPAHVFVLTVLLRQQTGAVTYRLEDGRAGEHWIKCMNCKANIQLQYVTSHSVVSRGVMKIILP